MRENHLPRMSASVNRFIKGAKESMARQEVKRAQTYAVVCSWCAGQIHPGVEPKSWRMCQACFQKMMVEHQHRTAQSQGRLHASER
jgi:hypothetical protein